ncbi:MAG: hypothetical protein QG567_1741 [Campylobacterota bacterium]|nr:hypothetical protein [Campylobacterota bacterium]
MNSYEIEILEELREIKKLIIEQQSKLEMFVPCEVSLSFIAKQTHKSRNAVRDYIMRHYSPNIDFWKKGGNIYVSQNVAIEYMKRSA